MDTVFVVIVPAKFSPQWQPRYICDYLMCKLYRRLIVKIENDLLVFFVESHWFRRFLLVCDITASEFCLKLPC